MGTKVQRNYSYGFTVDLFIEECCACGIVFGMPTDWRERRRNKRDTFHCPAGHGQHYTGKTDAEKANERAAAAERRAEQAERAARLQRERREATERSLRSTRGHLTRMRNRIVAGVCPVPGCQRTGLVQTKRHIEAKHPEWAHDHPDVLAP